MSKRIRPARNTKYWPWVWVCQSVCLCRSVMSDSLSISWITRFRPSSLSITTSAVHSDIHWARDYPAISPCAPLLSQHQSFFSNESIFRLEGQSRFCLFQKNLRVEFASACLISLQFKDFIPHHKIKASTFAFASPTSSIRMTTEKTIALS